MSFTNNTQTSDAETLEKISELLQKEEFTTGQKLFFIALQLDYAKETD